MAGQDRSQQLALIRAHCARQPASVLFDEPGDALLDVPSVKKLPLRSAELEGVEEKTNAQTGRPYLALRWGDGRSIALADVGVAFAPSTQNTGPMPELPEVACFRDFAMLLARLKHELYGHADRPPTKDALKLLMVCIGVLDGARAAGFEVGPEERELEHHLGELEKRAPPP